MFCYSLFAFSIIRLKHQLEYKMYASGLPFITLLLAVDAFPPLQVVPPFWMSGAGDGLLVFEHTEDMFDKYLIQRKLYDAWQTGLVLAEAMNMESFFWITLLRAQEVRNARSCVCF